MLPQTFTHSGYQPAIRRPHSWQNYLSRFIALVVLLGGLGTSQRAWGQQASYNYNDIYITAKLTSASTSTSTVYNGTYSSDDVNATTDFQNAKLGGTDNDKFDQSTGSLILTAVTANINSNKAVKSSDFVYRVYLSGTPDASKPGYSAVSMNQTSSANIGSQVTFANNSANIDLLNQPAVLGGGLYIVEVKFTGTYSSPTRNDANAVGTIVDPQNVDGAGYQATFRVIAPAITPSGGTTIWQSTNSTDWAIAANWSNGVPNANADAILPAQTDPATFAYPVLNDPNYNYATRNLTLRGSQNETRAKLIVNTATLTIYGNLSQISGGISGSNTNSYGVTSPGRNPTLIFAGADQTISGVLEFSDIIIAGTGTKSVTSTMTVLNILAFNPSSVTDGVILQSAIQDDSSGQLITVFSTAGNSSVKLGSSGIISTVSGQAETIASYIKGVTQVERKLPNGAYDTFGNIGIELSPNHDAGVITVIRIVGSASPSPSYRPSAKPIKRRYQIKGDVNSTAAGSAGATINVVFHYLPSNNTSNTDMNELNGILEKNLTMFSTTDGGSNYSDLGGNLNMTNHIVTRQALPTLSDYTLTLGDITNPLPVTLVAFGATRSGANTLLSWTTASEERNTGFNVQVSTDGTSFRTLSFVSSKSPNSSTTLNYQYTDTEAGKTGTRYYRLEQVDEGGAKNYSPVRLVNFSGTTTGTGMLVAYPNPFNEGVSLTLDGGTVADGTAAVKLVDMTGRTVRESKLPLVGASLILSDMGTLRSGLYLAKVTLPDGSTQTVRISKQ